MTRAEVLSAMQACFEGLQLTDFRGQTRVVVARDAFLDLIQWLRTEQSFACLVDITCVDYQVYREARQRFGMVYLLANLDTSERLTVRVMLDEDDLVIPSLVSFWEGANWLEREVWDMFGVRFDNHPDLRRILMPEAFTAHPLRKDYPLQGRGERHNFPVITRSQA